MTRLDKLSRRLFVDHDVMTDCISRFGDGVDELADPMPSFQYLRNQLCFLEERMQIVRSRLADYEREYVTPATGGGA